MRKAPCLTPGRNNLDTDLTQVGLGLIYLNNIVLFGNYYPYSRNYYILFIYVEEFKGSYTQENKHAIYSYNN